MPKRTNNYQKLLLYIHEQITEGNGKVTESAMLWDSISKSKREVDILIELDNPYKIRIGIECTERSRLMDVRTIEQLHQKHKNLTVNKTVIVTNKGYTNSAKSFAAAKGITLLTFDLALSMEWPKMYESIKGIEISHSAFTITSIEIDYSEIVPPNFLLTENIMVNYSEFGWLKICDFIYRYYQCTGSLEVSEPVARIRVWDFNPPLEIKDSVGVTTGICRLKVFYELRNLNLPWNYYEIDGKPVFSGVAECLGSFKRLAVVASPANGTTIDGKPKFNITIHADTK